MSENNAIPNGFKMTELGLMPEEWEVIKLGKIIKYNLGRTPPRSEKKYWNNGTIPWVSIADMKQNPVITHTKENVSEEAFEKIFKSTISKKGTLLMSFKLTIGRTSFLDIDATHNEAIISIYPEDNIDKFFLYYYLPQVDYSNYMDRAVKGNTLNKSKIERILIPLPPLPEQLAIASVLSTVQQAKEKTDAVIQATKALKKSLMRHLFTYGPVPVKDREKVPLKQTEVGKVPEEWEVVKLADVCRIIVPTRDKPKEFGGPYPWITLPDIKNDPLIISSAAHTLTKESADNVKNRLMPKGTVLLSCAGTLGKSVILEKPSYANQQFYGFVCNNGRIIPMYLCYVLKSIPTAHFESLAGKTTLRFFSKGIALSIQIPIPPLSIQKQIATILSAVDEKLEKEENKKKALDALFKTLLRDLMTAKLRVNHQEVEA